jgi:isopentenyl-diphosphate delta-isomerase
VETNSEPLILVDDADRDIGTGEKLDVHRRGLLHRAFSVIVWDRHGRLLLQKRAQTKYHSAGLWTNACCGHPRPGETAEAAAARRIDEEMGFTCPLEWLGVVRYRAAFDNGLTEHEIVHVFRGRYDGPIEPDASEVEAYEWRHPEAIRDDIAAGPERFSVWFRRYVAEGWPIRPAPSEAEC